MNIPTTILFATILGAISGCAVADLGGPTISNFKPPVMDDSKMTAEQRASFPQTLSECQTLANKAITPFEESAALYSEQEMTRITEKRRAVRRACLQGRGLAVLY